MTLSLMLVVLAAAPQKPRLGVLEFAAQGANPALAAAITSLASHELERLGVFTVVSADMVRALLGAERQKQLLGSENASPIVSDLVDFDFLVTGRVQKLGKSDYALVLSLLDTRSSKQVSSQTAKAPSESGLSTEVGPALVKLLGRVLRERSGSVVVVTSEVGAAVKLDDATVGVTPLPGRFPAGAGPHLLQIEKDGFVTWIKEVRVQPNETSEQHVNLVPSPDTIEAYESKASRMRVGAWLTTGLAGASAVSFFVCQTLADRAYEDFRARRDTLSQVGEGEGGINRTRAADSGQQVVLMQTLSYVSVGVFAASAVAGISLWIAGDAPGKYVKYRDVQPVASAPTLRLLASPGGVALAGDF